MPRYKVNPLTEEEYKKAPESVKRFIISVTEKIPISELEKAKTIRDHPQYFELTKPKSHSQKVKRFYSLKDQKDKLKKEKRHREPAKRSPIEGTEPPHPPYS